MAVHESSPADRAVSRKLTTQCRGYVSSHYLHDLCAGAKATDGHYAEDLEAQTFPDARFDLVITQDVCEDLFNPDRAIAEIVRTLKPDGAHITIVPIVNKATPSRRRARLDGAAVVHLAEPEYHGNPIGDGASLVTVDWGYDIADYLTNASGCATTIHTIDDIGQGIRAEYLEVVVTRKPAGPLTL